MENKATVISVLRALLLSNNKKGQIPLDELVRDYCLTEGTKVVPTFGHRNVSDFMLNSGEFIVNQVNGIVVVREKAKLESSHVKKLVTEQNPSDRRRGGSSRSNSRFTNSAKFISTFDVNSRKRITKHQENSIKTSNLSRKASVEFTFEDIMKDVKTPAINSLKQPAAKRSEVSSNFDKIPSRPSVVFTFEDIMKDAQIETPLKQPLTQDEMSKSTKFANKQSVEYTFDDIMKDVDRLKTPVLNSLNEPVMKQSEVYSELTKVGNSTHRTSVDHTFEEITDWVSKSKMSLSEQSSNSIKTSYPMDTTQQKFGSPIEGKSASLHRDLLKDKENYAVAVAAKIGDSTTETVNENNVREKSYVSARLKLLESILQFDVTKRSDRDYVASVRINNNIYCGYGSCVDEAKNEASASALELYFDRKVSIRIEHR